MRSLWQLLAGSAPSVPRRRRPRLGHRPELTALEDRRLQAVTMGIPNPPQSVTIPKVTLPTVLPIVISPQFLYPSNGRFVPVTVSGGLSSTYTMSLDANYAIFPKPYITASQLSQVPLPNPSSTSTAVTTGSFPIFQEGVKSPGRIEYVLQPAQPGVGKVTLKLPGYRYPMTISYVWIPAPAHDPVPRPFYQIFVTKLPISPFERSVIHARLNGRAGPNTAVLQVTDSYRRDSGRAVAALTPYGETTIQSFGAPISFTAQQAKYATQVYVTSAYAINRFYTYHFQINLQALKNPGTDGRQYIINVSAEDADDAGSVNAAVIVPASNARTARP